ncbi:phage portal family protein [Acinetobacter sp. 25977_10]|nr:phage portal family protein [Acinetobacter sp. 25977_10]
MKKGDTSYPFDSYISSGGAVVSPETALKLSAVWACVKFRAETISTLPLQLYDSEKRVATTIFVVFCMIRRMLTCVLVSFGRYKALV